MVRQIGKRKKEKEKGPAGAMHASIMVRLQKKKKKNLVKSSFDLSNQELQCLETKPRADKIVIIFKNLSNCSVLFRFLRI